MEILRSHTNKLCSNIQLSLFQRLHNVCWWTLSEQFVFHEIHIRDYMLEKAVITFTKIVQTKLSILCLAKTILRALSVASEQKLTLPALLRQRVVFGLSETLLLIAVHHLHQGIGGDIPQLVLWKHEMVACIYITIVLHYAGMATGLGQRTDARLLSHPISER